MRRARARRITAARADGAVGMLQVVAGAHYGLAATMGGVVGAHGRGQIRSNFFIDVVQWHLREFQPRLTCGDLCDLTMEHVEVKQHPANELFAAGHARSTSFQNRFLRQLPALLADDVSTIGVKIATEVDEVERVSQSANDTLYDTWTDAAFRGRLQRQLRNLGATISTTQLLNRATSQTCAGCHQLSSNGLTGDLGNGLLWPQSAGFVHVTETGDLSSALQDNFLPHRADVLVGFINAQCTGAAARDTTPIDPTRTIGGGVVGAAN